MPAQPEQLDRESLLLLYLADELDAEKRAQVDRQLASDPAFANALNRLREAHGAYQGLFAAADASARLPMSRETAVRRVSRVMKQWQVDRLSKPPAAGPRRIRFHLPWWSYGTGIAAAIIVGMIIWSSNLPEASDNRPTPEEVLKQQEQVASQLEDEWTQGYRQEYDYAQAGQQLSMLNIDGDIDDVFLRVGGER